MGYKPVPMFSAEQIGAMDRREFLTLESHCRRAVARQGYRLAKNPIRDPRAIGHGTYSVFDDARGQLVAGGMGLHQIALWINGADENQRTR
jgi:hypothetical protein